MFKNYLTLFCFTFCLFCNVPDAFSDVKNANKVRSFNIKVKNVFQDDAKRLSDFIIGKNKVTISDMELLIEKYPFLKKIRADKGSLQRWITSTERVKILDMIDVSNIDSKTLIDTYLKYGKKFIPKIENIWSNSYIKSDEEWRNVLLRVGGLVSEDSNFKQFLILLANNDTSKASAMLGYLKFKKDEANNLIKSAKNINVIYDFSSGNYRNVMILNFFAKNKMIDNFDSKSQEYYLVLSQIDEEVLDKEPFFVRSEIRHLIKSFVRCSMSSFDQFLHVLSNRLLTKSKKFFEENGMFERNYLAGFLLSEYLGRPQDAISILKDSIDLAKDDPRNMSKLHYLIGRCVEYIDGMSNAKKFYALSANISPLFYHGQASLIKIGLDYNEIIKKYIEYMDSVASENKLDLGKFEIIAIAALNLNQEGWKWLAVDLLKFGMSVSNSPKIIATLLNFGRGIFEDTLFFYLGEHVATNLGIGTSKSSYPLIYKDNILVNAVMRQESMFRVGLKNGGAVGPLQMTDIAIKDVENRFNVKINKNKLTSDLLYAAEIGSMYIGLLNNKYKNVCVAASAYNAGIKKTSKALGSFESGNGKIKDSHFDNIKWLELFNYGVTRKYATVVTESFHVYKALYS